MRSLEIEAKTIDEAILKACAEFNVLRDKLNIEIISEGSTGFFGILGSKKAKIRASILSIDMTIEEPPEPFRADHKYPSSEVSTLVLTPAPVPALSPTPTAAPVDRVDESDNEAFITRARDILDGILQRMNINCPIIVEDTPDAVVLNIQGDGSGLLIGKRGQNLDAIQYIVNKAVSRFANNRKMVIIDTEAYRKRREDFLTDLAERLADKVKKTKKSITLSHLNAHDRRIIHLALQGNTSLMTKSRGEGDYRKIVIMLAKKE
jgi:spoIIIJ-associated protein